MRGQQNGGVLAVIRENGAQNVVARRRINARDRLIEHIQLRLSAHRQDELHLLLIALAERFQSAERVDLQRIQHIGCLYAVKIRVKIRKERNQVVDLHRIVEIVFVGQIADDAVRVGARRLTVNEHRAACRLQQTVQQLDGRCFARAVRAEQTDKLSAAERQIQIIERGLFTVVFCQSLTDNQFVVIHCSSPPHCVSPEAPQCPAR